MLNKYFFYTQRLAIEISRNAMAATRAINGTTICGAIVNSSPLSTQQQQQEQDVDDSMTNSNITRTIDAYPTTNGTPVRYHMLQNLLKQITSD